jgi:hypothetical protein
MIKFTNLENLNGLQLIKELADVGIYTNTPPLIDANQDLWLDIDFKDTAKAQDVLNAHTPKPRPEPTIAEKLASVGLTIDDLKAALGL